MKQTKHLFVACMLLGTSLAFTACNKTSSTPTSTYDCSSMSDVTTNTTLAAGIYNISCNIDVSNGAVLTISPGATLIFSQGVGITVEAGSAICAVGSASQPIVFKGNEAIQGYWVGILIESISLNNNFAYCTISDGGSVNTSYSFAANVIMDDATASFTNCTISNSKDAGIYMANGSPDVTVFNTFSNNTLTGNNSYPIVTNAMGAASIGAAANVYTGNTNNYIGIAGQGGYIGFAGVGVNCTWNPQSVPYLLLQTGEDEAVKFRGKLTIMPGTSIVMGSTISLQIASTGSISAIGTAANPITFRGLQATAGYWGSIFVESSDATNTLEYCNVSDGGGQCPIWDTTAKGLISTYDGFSESNSRAIIVRNCKLSNSTSSGIYLTEEGAFTVTYNLSDIATTNTFSGCSPAIAY